MQERAGRYYFGDKPVEESGILVDNRPLTQEFLAAMPAEKAASWLDICSSCCGVPWFLLLPEQEEEMAAFAAQRSSQELPSQVTQITKIESGKPDAGASRSTRSKPRGMGSPFAPRPRSQKK